MSTSSIKDIAKSTDRYKLYILLCDPSALSRNISFIREQKINVIDIGKELALFITELDNYKFLTIEAYEFIQKLLDNNKGKIDGSINDVIAIHNIGILLEPAIKLSAAQLLKEFSKTTALIIIWDNQTDYPELLKWPTQGNKYFLDFSDVQIKTLQDAI